MASLIKLVSTAIILLPYTILANDILISNSTLTGHNTGNGFTFIQFDLSWKNSGPANTFIPDNTDLSCKWYTAWVFIEYRPSGEGKWKHVKLNNTGHITGTGKTVVINPGLHFPGESFEAETNPAIGVFIYGSSKGLGSFESKGIKLVWNYAANGIRSDEIVDIRIFATNKFYPPPSNEKIIPAANPLQPWTKPDTVRNFQEELNFKNTKYSIACPLSFNSRMEIIKCPDFKDRYSMNESLSQGFRPVYTWTGDTDQDWFRATNWQSANNFDLIPGSDSDQLITIPGCDYASNQPVINESSQVSEYNVRIGGTLTLEKYATLTLQKGKAFLELLESADVISDTGTIDEGRIILEPGAQYLNLSQNSPLLEVQKEIGKNNKEPGTQMGWQMISSPVSTSYENMFGGVLVTQGFPGSDFTNMQPNLMWWEETDSGTKLQCWRKPESISNIITAGRGHFHFLFDGAGRLNPYNDFKPFDPPQYYNDIQPVSITVTGREPILPKLINNRFQYSPFTYTPKESEPVYQQLLKNQDTYNEFNNIDDGWNLIGNPTPSLLNWNAEVPAWTKTNVDNTFYIWDPSTNNGNGEYLVWNGSEGNTLDNGLIPPFQAFWVKANGANPELSFSNEAKAKTGGNSKEKKVNLFDNRHSITLTIKGLGMKSKSFVSFSNNGITGPDPNDAYRLQPLTDTWLTLYTNSSPSHQSPLVINHLPTLSNQIIHIPLYVNARINNKPSGGNFILEWIISDDWPMDMNVILMNHKNKEATSMINSSQYSFSQIITKYSSAAAYDPLYLPWPPTSSYQSTKSSGSRQEQPFSIIILPGNYNDEPEYMTNKAMLLDPDPNPFKYFTTICFRIPERANVRIDIFDTLGRLIDTLAASEFEAGLNKIEWHPGKIKTGAYYIRMISGNTVNSKQLYLL